MSRADIENGHRWLMIVDILRTWVAAHAEREEWAKELSDRQLLEALGEWDGKLLAAARRAL